MLSSEEISLLWEKYFENKDIEIRNELVLQYENLVETVVKKMTNHIPPGSYEKEDLIQNGKIALIKAIERYKPDMGAKFETFATIKMQGYIKDQLRYYGKSNGGPSRPARNKIKQIEETIERLEQKFKRPPTSEEIAREVGITTEKYYKILSHASYSFPISLDENIQDKEVTFEQILKNEAVSTPEEHYLYSQEKEMIKKAMLELPKKEQTIIYCFFWRKMNLEEIAQHMNLTQGRISQLRKAALARLREKMGG